MPIQLTVNGNTYQYPKQGDDPNWGDEAELWAAEVTNVLNTLIGNGDILEDNFPINNNINVLTDISKLNFNPNIVQSATIDYVITRQHDNPTTVGLVESGKIDLTQLHDGTWVMSQTSQGDNAGVSFSITAMGQIQYLSTNLTGTNYSGKITFTAKALNV